MTLAGDTYGDKYWEKSPPSDTGNGGRDGSIPSACPTPLLRTDPASSATGSAVPKGSPMTPRQPIEPARGRRMSYISRNYAEDRVFPARSVVSLEPAEPGARGRQEDNLTPVREKAQISPVTGPTPTPTIADLTPTSAGLGETVQIPPGGTSLGRRSSKDSIPDLLYTTRFKHIVTDDGHAVVTGRAGTLQRCEDEPIHTPGAVQSFGTLLAIREDSEGHLVVRHASENSKSIIGFSPNDLFGLTTFTNILTEDEADTFLDHLDLIKHQDADPAANGPEVFNLSIRSKQGRAVKFWCAVHLHPRQPDLIICEFELYDDLLHPLAPADDLSPPIAENTLRSDPTAQELRESTETMSKPLRILRSARKRGGRDGLMQVFDVMSQVQNQLASAHTLEALLKILVGLVKELTGFHRALIYQFDSSFNGKVVAELVDTQQTADLYKGLHFPASDIPRQARDLYKINKVRILYDRDMETARIVCRSVEDLDVPLDMTHAYLRAMSPIHLKYLSNMAIRSSMSISINAFDDLWGLISCHSYGPHGMRVSFPTRKLCSLIGDTASRHIERLSYASRLQARQLINTAPTEKNPSGYIVASSEDLLKLFDADSGILSVGNETRILGKFANMQEALVLLEYLRLRKFGSVLATQDASADFADLRYEPGFTTISGLLYVPLSIGGNDFIVFFRKPMVKEVRWAGNPYEKIMREGTEGYLEPRKSFKAWTEIAVNKSREWSGEHIETAGVLCLVYGKFIEVWRQKEAALQSSQLTRLLLANSAHEVRTPLNAIINYLEIALEGSLDKETRDNLSRSHSASKSLIYVINDLLDLTKTEEGLELTNGEEAFDFLSCIREATEMFKNEANRKGIEYRTIESPDIPQLVHGDQRRVRQAVSNLAANAVQHTNEGYVQIETLVVDLSEDHVRLEISVQDTGKGMNNDQLDALFREMEQIESNDGTRPAEESDKKMKTMRPIGLGLAVVARIVRNMDGQLRVKSEEGKGSRFVVQLPFNLPSSHTPAVGSSASALDAGHSPRRGVGEPANLTRARSTGSSNSGRSSRNSGRSSRSDADRLIDAIRTPLRFGSPELEKGSMRRHYNAPAPHHDPGSSDITPTSSAPRPASPISAEQEQGSIFSASPSILSKPHAADMRKTVTPEPAHLHQALPTRPNQYDPKGAEAQDPVKLQVLVAEDDPINMAILRKRLEKRGHKVSHAVNGQVCASSYGERPGDFDVVLMDMQMPIVDGLESTKMIREAEKTYTRDQLSPVAARCWHIPIFAVSASLLEELKDVYVGAGFDGWILKPIDFDRLQTLLQGVAHDHLRDGGLYAPGEWERGGWFSRREESAEDPSPRR